MFAYWVLLLAGLVVAVKSNAVCDDERINDDCDYDVDEDDLEELEGQFPKAEFLDKHCSPALRSIRCQIDARERCRSTEEGELEGYQQLLSLASMICDQDSEVRKGYLENVDCYNRNMVGVVVCGVATVALVEDFVSSKENVTAYQNPNVEACLSVPVIVSCVIESMSQVCGEDETAPLSAILQFSDLFVESECPEELFPTWVEEFGSYMEENEELKRKRRHIFRK